MSEQTNQADLLAVSKEIAGILAASADRYATLRIRLEDPRLFTEVKRQALSTALLAAQTQNSALELIGELRRALPREQVPPMMGLLLLGSLASSCLIIASAQGPGNLADAGMLSAERLQKVISSKEVDAFLRRMLG